MHALLITKLFDYHPPDRLTLQMVCGHTRVHYSVWPNLCYYLSSSGTYYHYLTSHKIFPQIRTLYRGVARILEKWGQREGLKKELGIENLGRILINCAIHSLRDVELPLVYELR